MDIVFILIVLVFFAACIGFIAFADRLMENQG